MEKRENRQDEGEERGERRRKGKEYEQQKEEIGEVGKRTRTKCEEESEGVYNKFWERYWQYGEDDILQIWRGYETEGQTSYG